MHMVGKRDLNSAELDTMRTSRSPTTVMTANGEGAKPEKKRRFVSSNWTYSSELCFLKKLQQCFSWGNSCEDHGYTSAVKTTSHQKR